MNPRSVPVVVVLSLCLLAGCGPSPATTTGSSSPTPTPTTLPQATSGPELSPTRDRDPFQVHFLQHYQLIPCIGSLGYPFQNKQGKSFVENLARDVEKEEKIAVVEIISTLVWNGYPKEPGQGFGKKARSRRCKTSHARTDVPSSQHRGKITVLLFKLYKAQETF